MRIVLFMIAAASFVGCSNTPLSKTQELCQSADWYEKGRQDGATGESSKISHHQSQCNEAFNLESKELYVNGYQAGLTDYCSPENAFQIGQMGGAMENYCPEIMKEAFKQSYKKGLESRKLKVKNQELARKIENLSQKAVSRSVSSVEKGSISSELEQLKRQYAQNQKKLSRMNN